MRILSCLHLSLKSWLKTPVVFVLAILMLAVGIGASVAAYGFLNATLLQPLPVKNPHEIMVIETPKSGLMRAGESYDLMESSPLMADTFIIRHQWDVSFQKKEEAALLVTACEVSGNYFTALDVRAKIGRTIEPEDDIPGAAPVVVVSERFWKRSLDSKEDIIGASVRLNDRNMTVVGVIADPFRGTYRHIDVDVWFPHHQAFIEWQRRGKSLYAWQAQFRLRAGVSKGQVQAELDNFAAHLRLAGGNPEFRMSLRPEREVHLERRKDLATQSFFILGVLLTLLLLGCANVSNILLAKVTSRRNELAVRRVLGAPARSIFGLLIADGLVLSVIAAAAGVVLAFLLVRGGSVFGLEIPPGEIFKPKVLLFCIGTALMSGVLCGVIPAIQAIRVNINHVLKESSRTSTQFRTGRLLIVFQVALSLTLLIACGLFIRSLQEAQNVAPGIRTENLLSFAVNLEHLGGTINSERFSFYRRLIDELEAEPDIASAGVSTHSLLGGARTRGGTWASDVDIPRGSDLWSITFVSVGQGFFETSGIPIVNGRAVTAEEVRTKATTAMINESLATRFWPGEDPIGKEFYPFYSMWPDRPYRVVGVFRDFRLTVRDPPIPVFMLPEVQNWGVVVLRTRVQPAEVKQKVVSIVRSIDPRLPVQNLQTIDESINDSIRSLRAGFNIMLAVGIIGLMISIVGVYVALNYWIRRSSQEIGLRMALGAAPAMVMAMYMRRGLVTVLAGLGLGLAIAALAIPYVRELFYEVSPLDPVTFVGGPIVLFVAACAACYFSARRAARVEPMAALRED